MFYCISIGFLILALVIIHIVAKRGEKDIVAKIIVDTELPEVLNNYNMLLKPPEPPKPKPPEPKPTWFETHISPKLKEVRKFTKKLFKDYKFSIIEINIIREEED